MMQTSDFGGWLARQLVTRGFRSQRAFARAIDMDPTYLSRIINGHVQRPERETLERIAARLGLAYEEVAREAGALPEGLALAGPGATATGPAAGGEHDDVDTLPLAEVIAHVKGKPGEKWRAQVARTEARLGPEKFARWCRDIMRAWTSNGQLAIGSLELRDENGV